MPASAVHCSCQSNLAQHSVPLSRQLHHMTSSAAAELGQYQAHLAAQAVQVSQP
jgi:hypothetical protein